MTTSERHMSSPDHVSHMIYRRPVTSTPLLCTPARGRARARVPPNPATPPRSDPAVLSRHSSWVGSAFTPNRRRNPAILRQHEPQYQLIGTKRANQPRTPAKDYFPFVLGCMGEKRHLWRDTSIIERYPRRRRCRPERVFTFEQLQKPPACSLSQRGFND